MFLTRFNLESRDIFKPLRYFKSAELKSLDALFNVRGKRDPGKEIVVVMIDENSIKKRERYPLPRDHAVRACLATIDNQKRLTELNEKFKAEGRLQIKARIGLNPGTVLVGNVDSTNRLSYTVIGDEVNLGARLEAANKYYGT